MRGTQNIGGSAVATSYDNSTSGLSATNVQAAVDEVDSRLDGALNFLSGLKLATIVVTPNSSGEITIPFSDVGLTSRPNVVIVTGGNDSARVYTYLFDRSTDAIILNVYKNSSPVTGACRINILIYPYNKV